MLPRKGMIVRYTTPGGVEYDRHVLRVTAGRVVFSRRKVGDSIAAGSTQGVTVQAWDIWFRRQDNPTIVREGQDGVQPT